MARVKTEGVLKAPRPALQTALHRTIEALIPDAEVSKLALAQRFVRELYRAAPSASWVTVPDTQVKVKRV